MNKELIQYIQKQIRTSDEKLQRKYVQNQRGQRRPQRFMFVKMRSYLEDFFQKNTEVRLVIIPGLRGVGKTTLMAQVCSYVRDSRPEVKTLFISLDEVQNLFHVGIAEVLAAYEDILGTDLETLKEDVVIFFDEVQSDPSWAKSLKILRDKTSRVFFCCTGSSAVILQTTPDLGRGRAIFERMPPLCFTEFIMLQSGIYPTPKLKQKLRDAIYFSESASEVYESLSYLQPFVHEYWTKVDRREIEKFLTFGSLPFTLELPSESIISDAISLLVDGIIEKDLPLLENFDSKTLSQAKRLLFLLSENDTTSVRTLERVLDIDRLTITSLLDAFERAELLVKVGAYGSNMSIAKKPAKYLFMAPAIRMSFFSITGQEGTYLSRKGKLLEDSVGTHFYREFIVRGGGALRYDSAEKGADFILQFAQNNQIVVEVGMGEKTKKQVLMTMEKIPTQYGIIFSNSELSIDKENNIVTVPLDFYFLM